MIINLEFPSVYLTLPHPIHSRWDSCSAASRDRSRGSRSANRRTTRRTPQSGRFGHRWRRRGAAFSRAPVCDRRRGRFKGTVADQRGGRFEARNGHVEQILGDSGAGGFDDGVGDGIAVGGRGRGDGAAGTSLG